MNPDLSRFSEGRLTPLEANLFEINHNSTTKHYKYLLNNDLRTYRQIA